MLALLTNTDTLSSFWVVAVVPDVEVEIKLASTSVPSFPVPEILTLSASSLVRPATKPSFVPSMDRLTKLTDFVPFTLKQKASPVDADSVVARASGGITASMEPMTFAGTFSAVGVASIVWLLIVTGTVLTEGETFKNVASGVEIASTDKVAFGLTLINLPSGTL